MKRIATALLLTLVLAACGGTETGAPKPQAPPVLQVSPPDPAKAQEAARKLLAEYEKCGSCTGAERARERVENGLVTKPAE